MSALTFFLALVGLPLLGFPIVANQTLDLDRFARLAVAAAAGSVLVALEMMAATLVGIRFGVPLVIAASGVLWAIYLLSRHRHHRHLPERAERLPMTVGTTGALAMSALGIGLITYAAATARLTASDLVFFWGPKGQAFARAGAVDVEFLGNPDNYLMHSDYPPLLPSLYAYATDAAGRFAWRAALLSLPLFLGLTAAALWGFARPKLGARRAAEWTALLVLALGYGWSVTFSAGGAEPILAFFEVLALSSLVFGSGNAAVAVASLALTGCALTKVEGLPFAGAVAFAFSIAQSDWKKRLHRFTALSGFPLLAVGSWISYCAVHGLLFVYRGGGPIYPAHMSVVLKVLPRVASYDAAYLPWIVTVLLLASRLPKGGGERPLTVALLFLAFMLFLYLHFPDDPTLFIIYSAGRLLLTILTALLLAAASPPKTPAKSCSP